MHINHDAQLALLDGALPLMPRGATVIFVTSHWAHRYGEVEQFPAYAPSLPRSMQVNRRYADGKIS
jgi:hypothetical protein